MLPRELEPEVMDSYEEATSYDKMDHSAVNQKFAEDLLSALEELGNDAEGDYLDLGTGTAQIPVEICQRAAGVRVMAIDAAANMLDVARYNLEVAGLTSRIKLAQVDAKALPYEDGAFTHVISNSIVHHIPEPTSVLREAWRVLAPGGAIFIRDLMRPNSEPELQQIVATYAGNETPFQQKMFADSLRAALTVDEMRAIVREFRAPASSVQATSDRHWTWAMRKKEEPINAR